MTNAGKPWLSAVLRGVAERRAKRRVCYNAPLRGVDLLASEHRVTPLGYAALFRRPQQQP
jgi:hypothetical protein